MAKVFEEEDYWETLTNSLNITKSAIVNINKNCALVKRAECQWRELVKTYYQKIPSGDPYKAATDIANKLHDMQKTKEAELMEQLHFCTATTGEFSIGNVPGNCNDLWQFF